jgi:putative ABC transport system permease protein
MLADARSALRTFLRNPRFAAIAVVALALGIGAATAMYSVVHAVLMRPLPYHDPARLAVLLERKAHAGSSFPTSPANYLDWKAQSRSFESIAAAHAWSWDLTGRNRPEQLPGL